MSWGLCAFVSALGACHLCHRVFVHLLCLTGPPSMSRRCVHLSPLPGLALSIVVLACAGLGLPGLPSVTGLVFFQFMDLPSVLHGLCALRGFMYASLLAPQACPLHCEVCVGCRGLYAGPLLAPQAHPLCHGASVGFSQFPEPAIWSGLQSVSCFWAEKCSFLCFLPS